MRWLLCVAPISGVVRLADGIRELLGPSLVYPWSELSARASLRSFHFLHFPISLTALGFGSPTGRVERLRLGAGTAVCGSSGAGV